MSRPSILSIVIALIIVVTAPRAGHSETAGSSVLRPGAPWIATMLAEAIAQSPTLAALAARLECTRTIVQIVEETAPEGHWDGRISFLANAGGYRYLRVGLRRKSPALSAAVLAHELQHAVETHEAGVASVDEFERLYRRIGVALPDAPSELDTPAAIAAGAAALNELTHQPVWLSARSRRLLATGARPESR